MDFLNKGLLQISELFRSMTPAARITAGLLLLVVVIALGYLFNHQMSGPDEYLFGGEGVPAGMITKMEVAFGAKQLSAYQIEGTRIKVPRGTKAQYMAALLDGNAVPVSFGGHVETVANSNPIFGVSKQKQEEMRRVAIQNELAMVLRAMRGVENASVLIDAETERGLTNKTKKVGSVSLRMVGNSKLEDDRVAGIRNLVAGAYAGLRPEEVVVTDLNSGQTFVAENASGNSSGSSDLYIRLRRMHERDWEDKVLKALTYVPGVKVTANVDLNTDLQSVKQITKFDKPVAIKTSTKTNTLTNSSGPSGGRPGAVTNGANAPANLAANAISSQNTEEKTDEENQNIVPKSEELIYTVPLAPKEIFLTVTVPKSYVEQVAKEQKGVAGGPAVDVDSVAKTIQNKIQDHVAGLLPPEMRQKRDRVTVSTFADPPREPLPTPSMADHAMLWLGQYWGTLGMGFLGVFAMMTLRSLVRSAGAGTPALAAAVTGSGPSLAATDDADDHDETKPSDSDDDSTDAPAKKKRRLKSGSNAREELVEIVRENPDAAANILRTWIGATT